MGFLSDVKDFVLGGTDDSAQKAQRRANREAREFIEKMTAQARGDIFDIQPHADQARNAGYQSAIDMLTGVLPAQMSIFGDGNVSAQDILRGGFDAQRNAILGLPVTIPDSVRLQPDLSAFENVQLPEFTVPSLLAGVQSTPGETTNAQLVDQAYNQGLITSNDYDWHRQNFANTPNLGGAYSWSNSGNANDLIGTLDGSPLTPTNRERMVRLYNSLFGGAA